MSIYDVKGRIFDIQRFSVHDGPGIRTIVFLKGCFLRCKWCCNPESQKFDIEEMEFGGKKKIVGRDVTVKEVIDIVKRDIQYYRRSGGGMTLSGGESLAQPEFASALLQACKENGINTAMESTGFTDFKIIEEKYLPYLDYYLMDIKHTNSEKHEKFTGRPNELILENAKKIAEKANSLTIRVPVIPTFNDTEDEILSIAKFAESLPNVKELHLLPYHKFGMDKYKGLGRDYELKDLVPPTAEKMQSLLKIAQTTRLQCKIGG